jgi:hypothetical protein
MSEGFHVCNRSRGHCPILVMSPEPKDGKSIGENYAEAYSEITEVTFADKKTLLTLAGDQTVLLDKIKGLRENS